MQDNLGCIIHQLTRAHTFTHGPAVSHLEINLVSFKNAKTPTKQDERNKLAKKPIAAKLFFFYMLVFYFYFPFSCLVLRAVPVSQSTTIY